MEGWEEKKVLTDEPSNLFLFDQKVPITVDSDHIRFNKAYK
jgi:hypothetical protein